MLDADINGAVTSPDGTVNQQALLQRVRRELRILAACTPRLSGDERADLAFDLLTLEPAVLWGETFHDLAQADVEDVATAMATLRAAGVLEDAPELRPARDGRRQVVRRISAAARSADDRDEDPSAGVLAWLDDRERELSASHLDDQLVRARSARRYLMGLIDHVEFDLETLLNYRAGPRVADPESLLLHFMLVTLTYIAFLAQTLAPRLQPDHAPWPKGQPLAWIER